MTQNKTIVKYGEKLFTEKNFLYADSTFFRLFSFKLLKGKPNAVLDAPKMVVVTESTAKKYFGNEDPVGKILIIGSKGLEYQVTGVTEDCPSNSQIKYDFLASFSSLGAKQEQYWEANYTTYLLLKDKSFIPSLQAKIGPFMKKEMAASISGNDYISYELEHFKKIHLYSIYEGFEPNNSITYVYIVTAIALLILLIACFTYINLSTARSIERAKEVGIRKVAGAFKNQIFWQFISESLILAVFALILSAVIAGLILPGFNQLADRELTVSSLFTPYIAGIALLIIVCISIFAGSYPALVLSGFQPIKVLKGTFKTSSSGLWLRKSLIIFQFDGGAKLKLTFLISGR
jgi:putative ABC transport system permease protein